MTQLTLAGSGGVPLVAEAWGSQDDPPVVLLHADAQGRALSIVAARTLAVAGRYALALELSERPSDSAQRLGAAAQGLRAALAQLPARPAIVGLSTASCIALRALARTEDEILASGLVLVDTQECPASDAAFIRATLAALAGRGLPLMLARSDGQNPDSQAERSLCALVPELECLAIPAAVAGEQAEIFGAVLLDFLERRLPRAPLAYEAGSTSRVLRDALGCFATGVTVLTARDTAGRPVGLTANSFTSVSLEPPLLLACIARSASSIEAFAHCALFGVNVLHIGQRATSGMFARKGEDRFSGTAWEPSESGLPLLKGALASFECARHAVHDGGDHIILVGRVLRAEFEPHRDPLLYFRGRYRRLHFT